MKNQMKNQMKNDFLIIIFLLVNIISCRSITKTSKVTVIGSPSKELNIIAACHDSASIRFMFLDSTWSTYIEGTPIMPSKGKNICLILSRGFQDSLIVKVNKKVVLDEYIDNCKFENEIEDIRCSSPRHFTIMRKKGDLFRLEIKGKDIWIEFFLPSHRMVRIAYVPGTWGEDGQPDDYFWMVHFSNYNLYM